MGRSTGCATCAVDNAQADFEWHVPRLFTASSFSAEIAQRNVEKALTQIMNAQPCLGYPQMLHLIPP